MLEVIDIVYGSPDYKSTLDLRNKVMREPLGLSIEKDDLSYESEAIILGIKQEDHLIATGILHLKDKKTATVRFLCVDNTVQRSGAGGRLLLALEKRASDLDILRIEMEARVSAITFYQKFGYQAYGEEYLMNSAPIPHIAMKKLLQKQTDL